MKENISIFAGSADPVEDARKAVKELGIQYPLAWGLDVNAIAGTVGGFFEVYEEARALEEEDPHNAVPRGEKGHHEHRRQFLQPTGFLLRPDKTIEVACYSSAHIGRLSAKEVLELVRYYKGRK